jgi:hypothetical protein
LANWVMEGLREVAKSKTLGRGRKHKPVKPGLCNLPF